ncbi:hypothetical protein HY256_00340 [Candidatus Sumerlaeota bacterium]|nr:hypothetical protein [Candidatus Sumerlaeota bacterium]
MNENCIIGTDYPAAHSMDTCWFAVDSRGEVAAFFSGEDGHVPKKAPIEFSLTLPSIIAHSTAESLEAGLRRLPPGVDLSEGTIKQFIARGRLENVLLEVREENDLARENWIHKSFFRRLFGGPYTLPRYVRLPAEDRILVWLRWELSEKNALALVRDGILRRAWDLFEISPCELFGLHRYDYDENYGDPALCYRKESSPDKPLILRKEGPKDYDGYGGYDLESGLLQSVTFCEKELIQPWEFSACSESSEKCCYVASDGRTIRPIPNREGKFRNWLTENREEWERNGYIIAPEVSG